ncbi:hypothetical protein [Nitrosomonas sp.]|uniref:hypothetical protein n=1 Tax=Nitrosomonas sp. TaxID=42353 RepID=UPI0025D2287D|nr:hypothetical protein [Nitrosomonas sp.]
MKSRDWKFYEEPEGAHVLRISTFLLCALIFVAVAYTSTSDIKQCMEEEQSVYLCGMGNNR